jgi:hypothetical protein
MAFPQEICFKIAIMSLHPVAKCVELQEISCKTANLFSQPHGKMSKTEKLHDICYKIATFSLCAMAKFVKRKNVSPTSRGGPLKCFVVRWWDPPANLT